MCYIAGWGTKKVKGPATRILHEAALPLVSHEQCNGPKSYSGVIGGNLICAGYKQGVSILARETVEVRWIFLTLKNTEFEGK